MASGKVNVASGSGINIKNSAIIQTVSVNQPNLLSTLNGSGWVVGWKTDGSAVSIEIDGVPYSGSGSYSYIGPVKFNTSVRVYAVDAVTPVILSYSLSDNTRPYDGKNSFIRKINTVSEADTTTLHTQVFGKGWLRHIRDLSSQFDLFVDGVQIVNTHQRLSGASYVPADIRFETEFRYYRQAASSPLTRSVTYILD